MASIAVAQDQYPVPEPDPVPFVGRLRERARLEASLAAAARGRPQLVLVTGEAGIGKTRLCEMIADGAERDGFRVAWGRCWPGAGAPPMWPWQPLLRGALDEQAARLVEHDGERAVDPERFARFRAIAERIEHATRRAPLLLIIDDAQAADAGAVLLARFLGRTLARARLAIVLTRRTDPPVGEPHGDEVRLLAELERDATEVRLGGLDAVETQRFLAAHGVGEADHGYAAALANVTGGNPFMLSRAVTIDGVCGAPSEAAPVLRHVLARLSSPARAILAHAAILGRSANLWEVAAITGRPAGEVRVALGEAAERGVVETTAGGDVTFCHDLLRDAALAMLTAGEQLDAHAAGAVLLAHDQDPDRVARRAVHALAAAARSEADRAVAVDACRRAAEAMRAGFAYERAEELLAAAVAISEGWLQGDARVVVRLERAEAALAVGKLNDAREWFTRAADEAEDPVLAARAALGLGGVWVNEHRDELERRRALARQLAALNGLPAGHESLRAGLTLRLAAEAVYDGGPLEPVLAALGEVRASDDGAMLAHGLSLAHHAALAPEHLAIRRPLADELIDVASAAGEGVLALFGLMWRTVDLFHAGEAGAERSLAELGRRADALDCRSVLFVVRAIEVMCLIRAGRLDEAETAATACFELGQEVGDADALAYYAGHLLTIRWLQGRDHEIVDLVLATASSSTLVAGEFAFRAAVGGVSARAGRLDDARAALDALGAGGLAALPRSSTWMGGMVAVIDAAHALGDARVAREAYDLLAPFASQPVMPSLAVTCLGSPERALGLAAATIGDHELAVAHLERALDANRALGNRPAAALTRADLAEALLVRAAPGARPAAVDLLDRAAADAETHGMPLRARAWSARADQLRSEVAGEVPTTVACLARGDDRWTITIGDRSHVLPGLVGFEYLATLVERPGAEVAALELCGADRALDDGFHEVLDATAINAYRDRVQAIDAQLARVRLRADGGRAERLQAERDAIEEEVRRALRCGGRSRSFGSSGERARTAASKAIRRAVDAIAAVDVDLGGHLAASVSTGRSCAYHPAGDLAVRWQVLRSAPSGCPSG